MTNTYLATVTLDVAIKSDQSLEEIQNNLAATELRSDLKLIEPDGVITDTECLLVADLRIEDM